MKTKHTMKSSDFVRPFAVSKRKSYEGPILVTDHGDPVGVYMCMSDWQKLTKALRQYEAMRKWK